MLELRQGEFRMHHFLDGYYVNSLGPHVLYQLAASAVLAEAPDVLEEGPHHESIERLLDPKTRDALWARRAAVRERVRPRISTRSAAARGWMLGVAPAGAPEED